MKFLSVCFLALTLLVQPASAKAATNPWNVDNFCYISDSGSYFYLGGSMAGWYIHSGGGVGNCHLYNFTTATANPVSWAHYLLPLDPSYDDHFAVRAFINCEHNAPYYKYYVLAEGSGGGVTSTATTSVRSACNSYIDVISRRFYWGSDGASIQLVDNAPYAAEPQNADMHRFVP